MASKLAKYLLLTVLLAASCDLAAQTSPGAKHEAFDRYFEHKTLRIDFDLRGNAEFQQAALRQLRKEPVWAGPLNNLIDNFGYGGYYINIYSAEGGELIYSRGMNTLFEEWRTTEQAEREIQSWTNTICVPYPRENIIVEILERDRGDMRFKQMLSLEIDPASIFIDHSKLKENRITRVLYNGDPTGKADLVFVAEGYTEAEQDKFVADVERFAGLLFKTAPYDNHRENFNIWAVGAVSEESGTDISGKGVYKNTALNSGFYTFGIERYLTTPDMKSIRDAVWNVPCDAIFVLVNSEVYGGGGMYNLYAIGTADNAQTEYVFVHELGHSLAGLADEYFSKNVTYDNFYNLDYEPWEPNITTLVDFDSKWEGMLSAGTPVPTPLVEPYKKGLGVFEGGGYVSEGIYRPVDHCMMRDYAPFCPVCSGAIVRMINYFTDKEY